MDQTIDTTLDVPEELREHYDRVNVLAVNEAVADYYRHDPAPTPEGAILVRHRMRLVRARQALEAERYNAPILAAINSAWTCHVCGGGRNPRNVRTGELCETCYGVWEAERLRLARDDELEPGTTRLDAVRAYWERRAG